MQTEKAWSRGVKPVNHSQPALLLAINWGHTIGVTLQLLLAHNICYNHVREQVRVLICWIVWAEILSKTEK